MKESEKITFPMDMVSILILMGINMKDIEKMILYFFISRATGWGREGGGGRKEEW